MAARTARWKARRNMSTELKYSIVFGNDHKNPLGALQSLGQAGICSIAVCWGERTGTLESSKYLKAICFGKNAEDCVQILLDLIPQGEYGVITPCCDEAAITIDRHRAELSSKYRFGYSTKFSFEELSDKGLQTSLAKEAGLDTPEYFTIMSPEDIPQNPPYPCIVKPLVAMKGSKGDLKICNDREELLYNVQEALPHNSGLILQRYIDKEYEILIECCGFSDGAFCAPAIIKNELNRLYPPEVGLSALHEVIPFEDEAFRQKIGKLLSLMGYVGLISVEFAKSKSTGKYYFFEFNIRNDGYNPCMTKTGANINYYHVCDMLNIPFQTHAAKHAFVVSEVRHLQLLAHRKISFKDWKNDLKKSIGFTWKYKGDARPFYVMIEHAVRGTVKARIKKHTKK